MALLYSTLMAKEGRTITMKPVEITPDEDLINFHAQLKSSSRNNLSFCQNEMLLSCYIDF